MSNAQTLIAGWNRATSALGPSDMEFWRPLFAKFGGSQPARRVRRPAIGSTHEGTTMPSHLQLRYLRNFLIISCRPFAYSSITRRASSEREAMGADASFSGYA